MISRRPPFPKFPGQRVKGITRTSGEVDFRFRFRLRLKITLVIDLFQLTPSLSLPVPAVFSWLHVALIELAICGPDGITYIVMEHIPFVHYKCSLLVQIRLKARVHTGKIKVTRGKFHGIPNESVE